ncbi:hypothetical protein NHJ13734_005792 [Beauveria thailandica]
MKLVGLIIAAFCVHLAAAFGSRGVAERSLYYLLYLGEEMLDEESMRLATGCVGSRTGFNGVAHRCYLGEFLKWIEPGANPSLDKVGILGTSIEIGHLGDWGKQEDLVNFAKTMSDPEAAIRTINNAVDNCELLEVVRQNPPHEKNVNYKSWLEANPTWSPGMPVGEGITNTVVMYDKSGRPQRRAKPYRDLGPRPYKAYLNYPHLDGSTRGTTPSDFQEFFSTLSDNQQRIHNHVTSLNENDPGRARGLKALEFISTAMDHVIELREQDFWSNTIETPSQVATLPPDPDADNPNISEEEKNKRQELRSKVRYGMEYWFKDALMTDEFQGRWLKWKVPNREKTVKAAVAKHYFPSEAKAAALFDAFLSDLNPISIEHRNVIITMQDVGDKFHGHENYQPTVC